MYRGPKIPLLTPATNHHLKQKTKRSASHPKTAKQLTHQRPNNSLCLVPYISTTLRANYLLFSSVKFVWYFTLLTVENRFTRISSISRSLRYTFCSIVYLFCFTDRFFSYVTDVRSPLFCDFTFGYCVKSFLLTTKISHAPLKCP